MTKKFTFLVLVAHLVLTSCQTTKEVKNSTTFSKKEFYAPQLLNSERIRLKFGNYGIKVLSNTSTVRVSNLYSGSSKKPITRTFAVVLYDTTIDNAYLKEHQTIVNGGSIGRVFKSNGWKILKKDQYYGTIPFSSRYQPTYTLMNKDTPTKVAIRLYEFWIQKNNVAYKYATIAEVYHPNYLNLQQLKSIYKDAYKHLSITKPVQRVLQQVYQKMAITYVR